MMTTDLKTLNNEELNKLFVQIKNEQAERKIKETSEAIKSIRTKINEIKDLLKKYDLSLYDIDYDKIFLENVYYIEMA